MHWYFTCSYFVHFILRKNFFGIADAFFLTGKKLGDIYCVFEFKKKYILSFNPVKLNNVCALILNTHPSVNYGLLGK